MKIFGFPVIYTLTDKGYLSACPALNIISDGTNLEEARRKIRRAIIHDITSNKEISEFYSRPSNNILATEFITIDDQQQHDELSCRECGSIMSKFGGQYKRPNCGETSSTHE